MSTWLDRMLDSSASSTPLCACGCGKPIPKHKLEEARHFRSEIKYASEKCSRRAKFYRYAKRIAEKPAAGR